MSSSAPSSSSSAPAHHNCYTTPAFLTDDTLPLPTWSYPVTFPSTEKESFQLVSVTSKDDPLLQNKVIHSLFHQLFQSFGIDMNFQNVNEELDQLPGKYGPEKRGALFVLQETKSKEYIGCIALKDNGDNIAEAKRLFVKDSYRGRNLGSLLLIHIIEVARELSFSRIRLDTLQRLVQANKIYYKLQFTNIPPYNYNPEDDVLYFELPLVAEARPETAKLHQQLVHLLTEKEKQQTKTTTLSHPSTTTTSTTDAPTDTATTTTTTTTNNNNNHAEHAQH